LIIQTITNTGLNISTEAATDVFTAPYNCVVSVQHSLTNLANTDASFTFKIQHLTSGDAHIGIRDSFAYLKNTPTATTAGGRNSRAIYMASGEKLKIWILSSNASDTNVTYELKFINVFSVTNNLDKTGYDLTNTPNSTAMTAFSNNLLNTDKIKQMYSVSCGKVVRRIENDGVYFDFYDDVGVNILRTVVYTDDDRDVVEND